MLKNAFLCQPDEYLLRSWCSGQLENTQMVSIVDIIGTINLLSMTVLIVEWEVGRAAISVVGQWLYHNRRFRVRVFFDLEVVVVSLF